MVKCLSLTFLASLLTLFICSLGQPDIYDKKMRYVEAMAAARQTLDHFHYQFLNCMYMAVPGKKFLMDDLQAYLFHPAKTTVGYAPNFTSNRKFFANLLATFEYRNMVEKDFEELRKDLVSKLHFCDETVMDQGMLKEFHDREMDDNKF